MVTKEEAKQVLDILEGATKAGCLEEVAELLHFLVQPAFEKR
jgi:hypothetical protein